MNFPNSVVVQSWGEGQNNSSMTYKRKTPDEKHQGFNIRSLAVTYFHMGRPHTIIGAKRFHFRVRDGIGWFTLAMAARQIVATSDAVKM